MVWTAGTFPRCKEDNGTQAVGPCNTSLLPSHLCAPNLLQLPVVLRDPDIANEDSKDIQRMIPYQTGKKSDFLLNRSLDLVRDLFAI